MLAELTVPYVDTTALELVWTLDHPVVSSLAMAAVELPRSGARIELRVLGASHQVVLDDSGAGLVETVACLPGREPCLPGTLEQRVGAYGYGFRAQVEHCDATSIGARARMLRRMAEGDNRRAIVAAFPSSPDAVTALSLGSDPAGISWRTWHVYPDAGQIVTTHTVVTR